MKQFLFLVFLFLTYFVNAQNITVSNLIILHKLDVTDSEEYMAKLNWEFTKSYDDNNGFTYITFTQKDVDKNIIYLSKTYGADKFIGMSFYSRSKKISYVSQLKARGFVLIRKSMEKGDIVEKYTKNSITIEISTKPNNEFFISCGGTYD